MTSAWERAGSTRCGFWGHRRDRRAGTLALPRDWRGLAALLETARGRGGNAETQARALGVALFTALFTGEVLSAYDRSRQATTGPSQGLRIVLRVNAAELPQLPWELLCDPRNGEFLALSRATPIVRYVELARGEPESEIQPPVRILALAASPEDLPALDVGHERTRLEQALAPWRETGQADLNWLAGQTRHDLQAALQQGPWHVFHFVGHTGSMQTPARAMVVLADEAGQSTILTGSALSRLLGDARSLRLAVLNACESAAGDEQDQFAGAATTLVRGGLPAVLAMRTAISDAAAAEFTRSFYGALVAGLPVEAGLAEARKAIYMASPGTVEWATPVLYTRLRSEPLLGQTPAVTHERRDFYRHIPLPPNYVPRPELLSDVRDQLLTGAGELALTSAILAPTRRPRCTAWAASARASSPAPCARIPLSRPLSPTASSGPPSARRPT